jgi:hypothetical protein
MSTIYKNCTEAVVVISDINIKFMPSGKKGDTLDLAKFITLDKIKNSVDLQTAIQKQWLYNMARGARSAPQKVQVTSHRSQLKPKQPQMFVVYNGNMKGNSVDSRQKAIVYDNANRQIKQVEKVEKTAERNEASRSETSKSEASKSEGIKVGNIAVTSGTEVSVVATQQTTEKSIVTTKNAGCITMTTKTIMPENIPMDLVEQVAREHLQDEHLQDNALEATASCEAACEMGASEEAIYAENAYVAPVPAVQLNLKKCSFIKKNGKQCGMRKVVGSEHCYMHNQEI